SLFTRFELSMNKMVINHLDKPFVTNDVATIVNELEVQHLAAKLLVLAGRAQQEEIGDGANLTIAFAGELLQNAEELIRIGLHPSEIISRYNKAIKKRFANDLLIGSENMDVRNKEEVISRMKAVVASKQFGQEDILSSLVVDISITCIPLFACIQVCPKNPTNFNVDNVRVAKIVGGGFYDCTVVRGMVAVFAGGVDTSATETKGTVLIHTADQQENYAKTEEAKVEELIKAVADSGAKVIVSETAVGEMALHFCECYKLMVLKISSKFEFRRFCCTTGALKLCQPNPDDLGYVDSVSVDEFASVRKVDNSISTVLLRGSTDSILDDLEGAVDDGVNTYKAMCKDSRIVPGAAATKIELAKRYAIAKFAESFEMVPKMLAENAGLNEMEIISSIYAEHASGNTKVGLDLEQGRCKDVSTLNIWDLHITNYNIL
ncbi:hypothetical protein Prudu_008977, partial [Prunus dulcis]